MKRLAEHEMSRHICGEVCPPLENIGCSRGGIRLDAGDGQIDFLTNNTLPLFTNMSLAEASSQQLASGCMFLRIGYVEDARTFANAVGVQVFIPIGLVETRTDLVDIFEAGWIVNGDFIGCNPDNWSV